jgi:hypothetical protein
MKKKTAKKTSKPKISKPKSSSELDTATEPREEMLHQISTKGTEPGLAPDNKDAGSERDLH